MAIIERSVATHECSYFAQIGAKRSVASLLDTGCSNLCVLNVRGVLRVGELAFFSVFSGGSLEQVDISHCETVSDVDIEILASTCSSSLRVLKAAGTTIGDVALRALGTHCDNLTVLDLSDCVSITDEGVLALCPTSGIYCRIGNDDSKVVCYKSAARRGCPALKSFDIVSTEVESALTECSILGIAGLYSHDEYGMLRAEEGGMKELETLNIQGILVPDEMANFVREGLSHLAHLTVNEEDSDNVVESNETTTGARLHLRDYSSTDNWPF